MAMKLVKRRRFVVKKVELRDFGGDKSYNLKVNNFTANLREITISWKKTVSFSYYENYGYTETELEEKIKKLNEDVAKHFGEGDCSVWVHFQEESHYLGLSSLQDLDSGTYEVVE